MGNLSLRMLKKDTRYPRGGLFLRGMGSVHQTATKDPKTPSAKVIFLDSTSGVTEARSGHVSERSVTSWRVLFEAYSSDERLTAFRLCSLHQSWLSLAWQSQLSHVK
jgi:hypothetical protein